MAMQAGKLDRRVVIQKDANLESDPPVRNEHGEIEPSWSTLATVWAEKSELSGAERYVSEQFQSTVSVRWKIRYRADVTPRMRLSHRGEYYRIDAVVELGRREGLYLFTAVDRPDGEA